MCQTAGVTRTTRSTRTTRRGCRARDRCHTGTSRECQACFTYDAHLITEKDILINCMLLCVHLSQIVQGGLFFGFRGSTSNFDFFFLHLKVAHPQSCQAGTSPVRYVCPRESHYRDVGLCTSGTWWVPASSKQAVLHPNTSCQSRCKTPHMSARFQQHLQILKYFHLELFVLL